jgi:hypothetical protein
VGPADTESVWARLLGRCRALYHKTRVHGTGDKLPAGRLLFQRPRSLIATSIFFFLRKRTQVTRAAPVQVQRKHVLIRSWRGGTDKTHRGAQQLRREPCFSGLVIMFFFSFSTCRQLLRIFDSYLLRFTSVHLTGYQSNARGHSFRRCTRPTAISHCHAGPTNASSPFFDLPPHRHALPHHRTHAIN